MTWPARRKHLQDSTLLLLAEGQLSRSAAEAARSHLEVCGQCRERRRRLAAADGLVQHGLTQSPSGSVSARDRLAAGLAASAQEPVGSSWAQWNSPAFWLRVAAVAAVLVSGVMLQQLRRPLQDRMAAWEETGPEPDHMLTPGAANAVSLEQVCSQNDDDLDPKPAPEKERAVFLAYGISRRSARDYQVDYLINPQLGGNDNLANLWPEPYHATVWNAKAKDALEARLHGMVCEGQLDLQSAQRDLATDWIAAYKKYFHASRPVSTVASASETALLPR